MSQDNNPKRALVTGSSSGIGAAIARKLARAGHSVVVHGRDRVRTEKVAAEIRAAGGRALPVLGELTQPGIPEQIQQQVDAEIGGLDILVNNAGGRPGGWNHMDWFGIPPEDWLQAFKLNVMATVAMIERFAPGMKARGWGRIIQISSGIHLQQPAVFPDYQAAKAAEVSITRSLFRSLAGTGVTANVVTPGIIYTPGSDAELNKAAGAVGLKVWQDDERKLATQFFKLAANRLGRPDDIATAVLYFCGPDTDYVTGAHLVIDGGGATPYMF
jgi:3-oxoacyl-[acyl-carrier protein] reductase